MKIGDLIYLPSTEVDGEMLPQQLATVLAYAPDVVTYCIDVGSRVGGEDGLGECSPEDARVLPDAVKKFPRLAIFLDRYVWDSQLKDDPDHLVDLFESDPRCALAEQYLTETVDNVLTGVPFAGDDLTFDAEVKTNPKLAALNGIVSDND